MPILVDFNQVAISNLMVSLKMNNSNDVEEDSEEVKTLLVKFNNIQNDIEVNDDMISKYINEDNKLKVKLNKKEQKLNQRVL